MVSFKNFKKEGLPPDYEATAVWRDPRRVEVAMEDPDGREGEPRYTVTCSPNEPRMTSVAEWKGSLKKGEI
ncbi:MAG: hypothetical protein HY466_03160 [Deltaproteobacteria bacterium]|nr:hypothetical protein [Deltaproteobacteria bacterium]